MDVRGRRVLVTGASRGIGAALAERFAADGATVALVARDADAIDALAARLGGTAHPCDLTDHDAVVGLVERVEREAGPVDVLVNNAGIDASGWAVDEPVEAIEAIYRTNLLAPVLLCRQVLPRMIDRGRGHIANISSMAGSAAMPGLATYCSTKAGLSQYTAGLRLDLRGRPIGTTLVEIGTVPTSMLERVDDHPTTKAAFDRLYRLRLMVDTPVATIADAVADAVRHDRTHVRLPKRAAAFPLLAEVPRTVTGALLTGIRHRST